MKIKTEFKIEEIAAIVTVLRMVDMNVTDSTAIASLRNETIERAGCSFDELCKKLKDIE